MSLDTMTMVTVSGPEEMLDTAIRRLVINRDFHPKNVIKAMEHIKELEPFDCINPYTELLDHCGVLLKKMGIYREYRDFPRIDLDVNACSKYIEKLNKQTDKLLSEEAKKNQEITKYRLISEQLSHFTSLDAELSDLFNTHYLKCRLGKILGDLLPEFEKQIAERDDLYYFETEKSKHYRYGVYFLLPHDYQQADLELATHGFERIKIEVDGDLNAPITEVVDRLHNEMEDAALCAENIEKELSAFVDSETEKLLSVFANLKFLSEAFELRSYAGKRHARFYLMGRIPLSLADGYENECGCFKDFECVIEEEYGSWKPTVKKKKCCLFGKRRSK